MFNIFPSLRLYCPILLFFLFCSSVQAADTSLKLHYLFSDTRIDSVADLSGNGYKAALKNGAKPKTIVRFSVLDLGASNGYLDLTAKTGSLISTLTDFSVSMYVYVDPTVNITAAGNFLWTFANSDYMSTTANGNMFFSGINNRFAISKTNWATEVSVNSNAALAKGSWQLITYTQSGNTGAVYVNGTRTKQSTNVSVKPSDLGATTSNYIGKSCYSGDAYLQKSYIYDFRVYNRALTSSEVIGLGASKAGLDSATTKMQLSDALTALTLNNLSAVTSNLSLPTDAGNSIVISWSSSKTNIISNTGIVNRPINGSDTAIVVLTATLTKNGLNSSKQFTAKVIPYPSDKQSVSIDSLNLILSGNLNLLRSNLSLALSGSEGSTISWQSDYPGTLSNSGVIVNRPTHGSGNQKVLLTATIKKGSTSTSKVFSINVAEDEGFAGYLFAFFTGNSIDQENIRFALSYDGLVYTALNSGKAVVSADTVATTSYGLRDPHILRGENDDYYMVVTDMRSSLGWSSNRAMVLMKSTDLTHWSHTDINIPALYSQYAAADRIWAPQTIYDPVAKKYMIYFSMRLGSSDYDKVYYAYANSTFTALESAPKLLFDNNGLSTIDADIVLKDGVYNLFFKTEGNGNGIKKATSTSLTNGYTTIDKYLQSTTNAVEGGCVFRMYNTDNWILIYDMYTSSAYQFTTSTDLSNFSVLPGVSFDFTPRHGTIIPVTSAEIQRLNYKWGVNAAVESIKKDELKIYPNPAKDEIIVEKVPQGSAFSIYDISGSLLMSSILSSSRIDVSSLKTGLYLIQIKTTNETLTRKITIK